MNKEDASKMSNNTLAHEYADGLHSNDMDFSQGNLNLRFRIIVTSLSFLDCCEVSSRV